MYIQNIINNGKFKKQETKEFPEIEISKDAINKEIIDESLNLELQEYDIPKFQRICELFDLPAFESYNLKEENINSLLIFMMNLKLEYEKLGIYIDCNLEEIRSKQQEINKVIEIEKECDYLEVQLSNLKEEYKYYNNQYNLEELVKINDNMKYEIEHKKILNDFYNFVEHLKKNRECDRNLETFRFDLEFLNVFYFLKETDEYKNYAKKSMIITKIKESNNIFLKDLYLLLLERKEITLTDLRERYNLGSRLHTFKIAFDLMNDGIVDFDRVNDKILLKKYC